MDRAVFPMKLNNPDLLRSQSYLNGQWIDGQDGAVFPVDNPATGADIAHVANLGPKQAQLAIEAAHAAFPAWRARTAKERSNILRKWFDLINANTDDLARIMTIEQGKPFAEAKGEIAYGASFVEWFAEQAKRVMGDTISAPSSARTNWCLRGDYTVEFPDGHDHAQGRAGISSRLHHRAQTCRANASVSVGFSCIGRTSRHSCRRSQHHYCR